MSNDSELNHFLRDCKAQKNENGVVLVFSSRGFDFDGLNWRQFRRYSLSLQEAIDVQAEVAKKDLERIEETESKVEPLLNIP